MPKLRTQNSELRTLSGQTLIETVTALAVVVVLVASLVAMAIASVRSATLASNKTIASQLAYQQLEEVRSARDSNLYTWSVFNSTLTTSCASSGQCSMASSSTCTGGANPIRTSGPCSLASSSGTSFSATIYAAAMASGLQVTAVVSWTDSLGLHSEKLSTIYTDWR